MKRLAWVVVGIASIAGCGGEREKAASVVLADVPQAVIRTAKEKLPDVKFDQAWKTRDGDYEVRGRAANGKVRDVRVKPTGEFVEVD